MYISMAICKLTKSEKAVLFIDEEGNVFGTSVIAVQNMLNKSLRGDFVLLSKFPYKVNKDRFKPSPLYEPPGYVKPKEGDVVLDKRYQDNKKANEAYSQDVKI
jgi:signal peptidase I